MSIDVGDRAPELHATTSDGQEFRLSDLRSKKVAVIFFYPKDNSPFCTQEACSFRDSYEDFVQLGAEVIGISGDSDDSHLSFAKSHQLPFRMIADKTGAIRQAFDVPRSFLLLPGRVTYVIDLEGIVRLKFNSAMFPNQHVKEALRVVESLTKPR